MPWNWKPERCSTASRMVLLGMVPVLMQAPPTISRCFDHGDTAAALRALNGGALPGRARTDNDEIVIAA